MLKFLKVMMEMLQVLLVKLYKVNFFCDPNISLLIWILGAKKNNFYRFV